jgi:ABC-type transporter Mla MlaB component
VRPPPPPADAPARRGIVRLLNTTAGPVLCLAGEVDAAAVEAFLQRYGREPAPVERIETGSVTQLSAPALDLLLDHVDAAERAGRPVQLRRTPQLARLLAERG